jgi:hypothetical protein
VITPLILEKARNFPLHALLGEGGQNVSNLTKFSVKLGRYAAVSY